MASSSPQTSSNPSPSAKRKRSAASAVATQARAAAVAPAVIRTPAESARDYQSVALVLQGGGALGSYQCGVYEGLHAGGIAPDWFVGTSIGAINAAIMAGNAPGQRVERLHQFWDMICEPVGLAAPIAAWVRALLAWSPPYPKLHEWANSLGALGALAFGQRGFFQVRQQPPFMLADGSPAATSFYDTAPLQSTLEQFIDFDRINARKDGLRLSVGAVQVETGNSRYFDSAVEKIGPEHIMASGALPPAFAAIEIEGKHYWDGGIVSNTPLECVWNAKPRRNTLVLQVDLWSARGKEPQTMMDVMERQKDIQYSSRTRLITDHGASMQKLRLAIADTLAALPEDALAPHLRRALAPWACTNVFNIVHLIYQDKPFETMYKDYAFGIGTQHQHWADGLADMQQTLEHPDFFVKPSHEQGVVTHDVHRIVGMRRRRA